ncbi:MAG: sulfatase [Verrucomicrobiota bacterium]
MRFLYSLIAAFVALPFTLFAADRPNILFAIADDLSYPHMGAYGAEWVKTPGFDRVAKEGLLFMRAYTPNAKCAPSRACVLTGRNSWQLEEAANHWCFFPAKFKGVVEALGENGYFTGYTAKGWAPGVANDAEGKPRQLTGKPFNKHKTTPPTSAISSNDYAKNFEDFLDANKEGKPWFFWYGSTEPHRRYEFGSGVAKGGKKLSDIPSVPEFWPDTEAVRHDMLDYAFETEHFDTHLAKMLDSLEKRGELENTLVMVTADNGMPFPRTKGQKYEYSNHLPFAAMWPKGIKKPDRKVADYVSFIDFAPTWLDLAGVDWENSGMQPHAGRSLTDIFGGESDGVSNPDRDHVLIGKERHDIGRPDDNGYPVRGIVKNGMLYLQNFETDRWPSGHPLTGYLNCDGGATKTEILTMRREGKDASFWQLCFGLRPAEEMYNVELDPECMRNLASDPAYEETKAALKNLMLEELRAQNDPRMLGKGAVFDDYPYASEKWRGFYERFVAGEEMKAGWVNDTDFEKTIPELP